MKTENEHQPSEKDIIPAETLEGLNLPKKLVFIDLNGTLISEKATSCEIEPQLLSEFKKIVVEKQNQGISLGLCSDSPLPQLSELAIDIGLSDGPIVAENGNLLAYHDKLVIIRKVPQPSSIKDQIVNFAMKTGYQQKPDVTAVEFGGILPAYFSGEWAFGANRLTSISIFGPSEFISSLGVNLELPSGVSFDSSPEYNYFAVHAGILSNNKGATLSRLAELGSEVLMIGNSKSDWVDPASDVKCAFVAGSRISPDIAAQAVYLSQLPTIQGVIDILKEVTL